MYPYMESISNYLHIVISTTFSESLGQNIVELLLKLVFNTNQSINQGNWCPLHQIMFFSILYAFVRCMKMKVISLTFIRLLSSIN